MKNGEICLKEFAKRYRVKVRVDSLGELIIPGKRFAIDMPARSEYSSHIFEYGFGNLGLFLSLPTRNRWTLARKKLTAAGFRITQVGDQEGAFCFDPKDAVQSGLAVRAISAKRLRMMSQERRQNLLARLSNLRIIFPGLNSPPVRRPDAGPNSSPMPISPAFDGKRKLKFNGG
jgi:hypothetical protein